MQGSKLASALRSANVRGSRLSALQVYGLGELQACSSRLDVAQLGLLQKLKKREVVDLLSSVSKIAQSCVKKSAISEITCKTLMQSKSVVKDLRDYAHSYLSYPPLDSFRLYGFRYVFIAVLVLFPRMVGHWLRTANLSHEAYKAIVSQVIQELHWRDKSSRKSLQMALLRTGNPFLQTVAVSSLASIDGDPDPMEFSALLLELVDAGVVGDDRIQLATVALTQARVMRLTVESRLEAQIARRAQVIRDLAAANGGSRYEHDEVERLEEEAKALQERKAAVERRFENIIEALSLELRNARSLSGYLTDIYEALSLYAAEVLVRVVERSGQWTASDEVLDAVIQNGTRSLGLSAPFEFAKDGDLRLDEFQRDRAYFAAALALRYKFDGKGAGHRTGQLLGPLSQAADRLLNAPYAAARWHLAYRNALHRRMASVLIALDVASSGTKEEQAAKTKLMEVAVDQAELLLKLERPDKDTFGFADALTACLLEKMQNGLAKDRREKWRQSPNLDNFTVAVSLWSSPEFVCADEHEARRLFIVCTDSMESPRMSFRALNRALNLLDVAFVAALAAKSPLALQILRGVWGSVVENRKTRGIENYADSFAILEAASNDRQGGTQLQNSLVWSNSRTANFLKSDAV